MKRTTVGSLAVMTAALLAMSGCAGTADPGQSAGGSGSDEVVFAGYGGAVQEALVTSFFEPFTADTDITVELDDTSDWAKVQAMVDAGNVTWDLVEGGVTQGVEDNEYLTEIDCTVVDCAAFDTSDFPVYPQAVPFFMFSYAVAYNGDTWQGAAPTGFDTFFDPATPGARGITGPTNGWKGLLEAALLYDGVDRDELYPLDVDRALAVFDGIKDQLVVFADQAQCVSDVTSGETALALCWSGRVAAAAVDDGAPLELAWGKQVQVAEYLYIPAGAPNVDNAQKLLAYVVDNQGAVSEGTAYSAINPLAETDPGTPYFEWLPLENVGTGDQAPIVPDVDWWTENQASVAEQIAEWLAS